MQRQRKFGRTDLIAFLRLVDSRLTQPGTIRLIGGAVVGLCYLPAYQTRDMDYAWADREVQAAVAEVEAAFPGHVMTSQTGVYFAPYSYENRLQILDIPGLTRLSVQVPERHDLAVMKITRGIDRDIESLEQIHLIEPFVISTLVERFNETWVTGPQRLADLGFLSLIETLFGPDGADDAERLLRDLRRKQ